MPARPRVHEIAAELGFNSKVAISELRRLGVRVKGPSSQVSWQVAQKLRAALAQMTSRSNTSPLSSHRRRPAPRWSHNDEFLFSQARAVPTRQDERPTHIRPDVRDLRLGLGLSLDEAARIVEEAPSLFQRQEGLAASADPDFVTVAAAALIEYGVRMVAADTFPRPATERGRPTIAHMRAGLGLSTKDAALIVRLDLQVVAEMERTNNPLPRNFRENAFKKYIEWAAPISRGWKTLIEERELGSRKLESQFRATTPSDAADLDRKAAEILRAAYLPPIAAAERAVQEFLLRG